MKMKSMHNDKLLLRCPTCGEFHEVTEQAIADMDRIACPHCMKTVAKEKFMIYEIAEDKEEGSDTTPDIHDDDDFYGI